MGKTAIKWLVSLSALIAVTAFYQAGNTKARAANRFVMTTLAKGRFGETKVFSRFIPQNGWRLFVRVASVVGDMKSGLSRKWSRDNTIVIYTHKVYGVLVGHIRGEVKWRRIALQTRGKGVGQRAVTVEREIATQGNVEELPPRRKFIQVDMAGQATRGGQS